MSTLYAQVHDQVTSAGSLRAGLPPEIDPVLARAMAKDRDYRYARCGGSQPVPSGAPSQPAWNVGWVHHHEAFAETPQQQYVRTDFGIVRILETSGRPGFHCNLEPRDLPARGRRALTSARPLKETGWVMIRPDKSPRHLCSRRAFCY